MQTLLLFITSVVTLKSSIFFHLSLFYKLFFLSFNWTYYFFTKGLALKLYNTSLTLLNFSIKFWTRRVFAFFSIIFTNFFPYSFLSFFLILKNINSTSFYFFELMSYKYNFLFIFFSFKTFFLLKKKRRIKKKIKKKLCNKIIITIFMSLTLARSEREQNVLTHASHVNFY